MIKSLRLVLPVTILAAACLALADEEPNPIQKAMRYAHKAPQGEKKIGEKIVDGTASDDEVQKTLTAYKAMADCKPPRGDEAAFKEKVARLITATEHVASKKPSGVNEYKDAVNCKACHSEHKPQKKA
jgi:hypothetical protein